jgi:hypothetical protein
VDLDQELYPDRLTYGVGERPEALDDLALWVRGGTFHRYGQPAHEHEEYDRTVDASLRFTGELVDGRMRWRVEYRRFGVPHIDGWGMSGGYAPGRRRIWGAAHDRRARARGLARAARDRHRVIDAGRDLCKIVNVTATERRSEMAVLPDVHRFEVCDFYSGAQLAVYDVENALQALDAYADDQGIARYHEQGSTDPDAVIPTVNGDGTASAPFCNYEIVARRLID